MRGHEEFRFRWSCKCGWVAKDDVHSEYEPGRACCPSCGSGISKVICRYEVTEAVVGSRVTIHYSDPLFPKGQKGA